MPLLTIEFNLILSAAQMPVICDCFQRLFLSTVVMFAFRYAERSACKSVLLKACVGFCPCVLHVHGQYWVKVHNFPKATEMLSEASRCHCSR